MFSFSVHEVIKTVKGVLLTPVSYDQMIRNISTDTRNFKPGSLFFALRGKNFDGHDFIKTAVARKASGLVISQRNFKITGSMKKIPVIRVANTTQALGQMARHYRNQLPALIIAITGSNGKTTTRKMLAHLLTRNKNIIQAKKSFNNMIGVSLTLLGADTTTEYIILELGSNHPGEIDQLASICRPHIGLITNIGASHLQGFKNMLGVAREKKSLIEHLDYPAIAIWETPNKWFNRSKSSRLAINSKYTDYRLVSFSTKKGDIKGSDLVIKPHGIEFMVNEQLPCTIPILGKWNMKNALAALAAGMALGLNLKESIARMKDFTLPPMRMEVHHLKNITVINDAYNANPSSVRCVIEEFKSMKTASRKIFVLGDMLELGRESRSCHRQAVQSIIKSGVQTLVGIGKELKPILARLDGKHKKMTIAHFNSAEEAGDFLGGYVKAKDMIILKGSRGIGLEAILPRIKRKMK
ncbi:MAG: UDP-N-acetylmuramoyl-tripeptide--D-alanyl-D-alanine ligase, partial [Planctomycetes bacterium]|nr:UDP-N-acetylmuramoyl-tripeptide--D-alanyl-D-alanine ligase [Planctomycetota bacterium]